MTTWTPINQPSTTWTAIPQEPVFDPAVFDLFPVFDTGSTAWKWTTLPSPSGIWTKE